MKRRGLVLVMASLCFAIAVSGQKRYNEYILSTPQGEVKVNEEIGTPSVSVSVDDLLNMVLRPDEIPSHYCLGTRASLNLSGILTCLERQWSHEEHKIRGQVAPFYGVSVYLRVYSNVERAQKAFYVSSGSGEMRAQKGTVSGVPLGDECGHYFPLGSIIFRVGRAVALVSAALKGAESREEHQYFTEVVCVALEYRLRRHPKIGALPSSKVRLLLVGQPVEKEVVALHEVAVVPCRVLKGAGVQVKEHRDAKAWWVQLTRGKHRVQVKAFDWKMETEKGKVKLERPVFPDGGELIVPLSQVAEALGLKVQQKGQTMALLAK